MVKKLICYYIFEVFGVTRTKNPDISQEGTFRISKRWPNPIFEVISLDSHRLPGSSVCCCGKLSSTANYETTSYPGYRSSSLASCNSIIGCLVFHVDLQCRLISCAKELCRKLCNPFSVQNVIFTREYTYVYRRVYILPGRLARQTCRVDLPVRLARQTCPADLPGRLARQTCPADLPGRLARQTCPADLPVRLARSLVMNAIIIYLKSCLAHDQGPVVLEPYTGSPKLLLC
jgi:hypothetical protein